MNQAAFLQIWSQPANSPTIDSSTDSGTIDSCSDNSCSDISTAQNTAQNTVQSTVQNISHSPVSNSPIQSSVQSALYEAASQLQAHLAHEEGDLYRLEDLQQVLVRWLESSIESLAEDALFHTLEGDRTFAFNRHAFEQQMQHLRPLPAEEAIPVPPASTIAA